MARQKGFIETNVYEEAKKRIHHIYDTHDHINVAYSGGKDSTVILNLVWEVAQERGLDSIDAHHRDEELNPGLILDNVKYYYDQPWCNMTWYALPKHGSFFCLGITKQITYWDTSGEREWLRPKPEWAETMNDRTEVLGRHGYDQIITDRYPKGKVAIINGIRAEESLVRYRSVVNKLHDNYIVSSSLDRTRLAKPIYDWMENDVFKYFYDNNLRYSAWYEQQLWSGDGLRVAPPLIAESMKTIDKWAQMDPEFYNRLTEIFPEVRAHERYKGTISDAHIYKQYGKDMEGVKQWIEANVDPEDSVYGRMLQKWKAVKRLTETQPERYLPGGTAEWVLKHFVTGKIIHGDIYPMTTQEIRQKYGKKKPKINKNRRKK